jgi:hypothetical protein
MKNKLNFSLVIAADAPDEPSGPAVYSFKDQV